MPRWLKWLLVAAAALALITVLKLTIFAAEPLAVRVFPAERGVVEETVTNSRAGTVRARRRAKLSPEIGGQVTAIPHREGERVTAGAVLLQLDDRSQRAHLMLSKEEVDAARAESRRACLASERAARELARVERLAADEIVSADLLDQVESARATAEAACQASQASAARAGASLMVARTELDKTVLRAPFDGVVAEVTTEIGEWTTPSPPALPVPPVIDVLDPASIYVSAPMDEVDSARIRSGMTARVSIDSHRDQVFSGRVLRVAPYVLDLEEQNRTVEIEVELEDEATAATLLPGTSADVEVILSVREEVLRIPTSALIEGKKALVLEAGELHQRSVVPGLRNWDFTEIREGVAAGDRIVISLDQPEVQDGAQAVEAEDSED